jgi:hypothetical protein
MDTLSFFAGALLGIGVACLGFGLLFYRYMTTNTEENLKHYKELQRLVNKLEDIQNGDTTEKREE